MQIKPLFYKKELK